MNVLTYKGKRKPEKKDVYKDKKETEIYWKSSQKGPVALVEKGFVKSILKQFGHMEKLKLLDVGSGPGWIPVQLAKARPHWQITAVDASNDMLEKARRHAEVQNTQNIRWVQGYAEQIDFPNDHFDLIISHFAFHEFQKPLRALQEMARVVKKGGHILIQDLGRTPVWYQALSFALGLIFTLGDLPMIRQYRDSIRSAYTLDELKNLLKGWDLKTNMRAKWTLAVGIMLQVKAEKG